MKSNRAIWSEALADMEDAIAEKELEVERVQKELEKLRHKKWSVRELGYDDGIKYVISEEG